ncbi:uncharacterized protein [Antedon mediterranea]|uniref:uncharacterized protein n=1 Tax=Antedon mediterranea TaxID=105859 RepID=UPI003AF4806E
MTSTRMSILKNFKVNIGPGKLLQEDFNKRGYIHPSRLALLHQYARLAGLRASLANHHDVFFKNSTLYIRHQTAHVNTNLTSALSSQPIHADFTVTYLGSSSLLCNTRLILENEQQCYSTCTAQCIGVDKQTRKPAAFDETVRNIYAYAVNGKRPVLSPLLETPQSTGQVIYNKKIIIREEHVDSNGHTNNAAYMKLCDTVFSSAITDGILCQEFLESPLRDYTIQYLGESVKGDEICFDMWQDSQNKYLIHFEAKKSDSIVIRSQFHLDNKLMSSL